MALSFPLILLCLALLFGLIIYVDKFDTTPAKPQEVISSTTYNLNYNEMTREVILNNFFVVAAFRSDSLNCHLFEYFQNNPDREISYDELDQKILLGRSIRLCKVADQMGFKADMKKALFTTTQKTIIYHPSRLNEFSKIRI